MGYAGTARQFQASRKAGVFSLKNIKGFWGFFILITRTPPRSLCDTAVFFYPYLLWLIRLAYRLDGFITASWLFTTPPDPRGCELPDEAPAFGGRPEELSAPVRSAHPRNRTDEYPAVR